MKNNAYHTPVLLDEAIGYLKIEPGKQYVDATLGGGGHTQEMLKRGGLVLGIDVDQDALDFVNKNFKFQISNFKLKLAKGNFKDIDEIALLNGFKKVWGILFDLGVSSHQIDTPERGFSFLKNGPLDMRMDKNLSVKAADLINILTKGELYEIFNNLGQEHNAWFISNAIISARRVKKIETVDDLEEIIARAYRLDRNTIPDFKKNEIYKRIFQALRIAVNSELENLKEGLSKSINLLESKGRIAVISFHSLEDKIVKDKFKEFNKKDMGIELTEKPVSPSLDEANSNSRSKSAKLRVFERK
jgi:16S rRNA (cytosine1402-N4)-methyltransferase